eukprot:gb/GFBE01015591.1/.p1 GENE.gb/GFBE01015591.1/~~gb/GFBE01015591.1/.p1  ORF type:complete len:619 (+),score=145.03 gb/GFBE01015591.1/:1-1857(+)
MQSLLSVAMPSPAIKASIAFACVLLAHVASAAKMETSRRQVAKLSVEADDWCEHNVFPNPGGVYNALGKAMGGDVVDGKDGKDLKEALAAEKQWAPGARWEFKAKVTSGYGVPLFFGFPGGSGEDGAYLDFKVPANAADAEIHVKGQVHAHGDAARLEYLGADPPALTDHSVNFTSICLRPQLCADFDGCLPAYFYRVKETGTGQSMDECCEPITCKDSLPDGCQPETQWTAYDDFETRLGDSLQRCCKAQVCTDDICDAQHKPKAGTGLLGTTMLECCEEVYCHSFPTLCDPTHDMSRLPDYLEDGSPRLGSTEDDCCNVIQCVDFNCSVGRGLWANRENPNGSGHTFHQCCDPLYCANFTCEGSTWSPKENPDGFQGSTHERCCKGRKCSEYECEDEKLQLVATPGERFGSTDDECCEPKRCRDYTCSSSTQYDKLPEVEEVEGENGKLQIARHGFSDEECCEPLSCSDFHCQSTKWTDRPDKADLLGSTYEECCDKILCQNYTCTSDYDGDGQGTMYYKRRDTNAFKHQGSTDEECCHPKYCSQYVTKLPSQWVRKVEPADKPLLGSTDPECYDPRLCSEFCDCKPRAGLQLIPHANETQGSSVEECCEKIDAVK